MAEKRQQQPTPDATTNSPNRTPDRWADWLLRGRQRGMGVQQQRRLHRDLARLRDRVLRGARLRPGERVLDIGAGTGLIALGARRRVGRSGRVVALDVSRDALLEGEREAAADPEAAPLLSLRADAVHLPLADESFDAVFTRSVLIYVEDKRGAVREIHRVLRPGGRVSIFEPINSAARQYQLEEWSGGRDLSAVAEEHRRIIAFLQEGWEHKETMLGFDERDLVRWFAEAGFRSVRLTYELIYEHGVPGWSSERVLAGLRQRPNPSMLSYEEGARAVLGDAADAYLARYVELLRSQPGRHLSAAAYLSARRAESESPS